MRNDILIFDKLKLGWDEIHPRTTFDYTMSIEAVQWHGLRGFRLPGRATGERLGEVEISLEGLTFPDFGAWDFISARGPVKLLLLDPAIEPDDRLIAIARFLMQMIWHSATDTYLAYPEDETEFRWKALLEKAFYSDQPLGLKCGDAACFVGYVLQRQGFFVRARSLVNPNGVGHTMLEAWLPESGRWIYLDPDFGVVLQEDDRLISADRAVELRLKNQQDRISIVDLGGNRHVSPKEAYPLGFYGQHSWSPAMDLEDRSLAHDPYFREIVLDQGMLGLNCHDILYSIERRGSLYLLDSECT